jgi:hypothetical protein
MVRHQLGAVTLFCAHCPRHEWGFDQKRFKPLTYPVQEHPRRWFYCSKIKSLQFLKIMANTIIIIFGRFPKKKPAPIHLNAPLLRHVTLFKMPAI